MQDECAQKNKKKSKMLKSVFIHLHFFSGNFIIYSVKKMKKLTNKRSKKSEAKTDIFEINDICQDNYHYS